jgi:predicted nucleotidyltransferase
LTPTPIEDLLAAIVARAAPVSGAEALVLGGSRARGTHQPSSDIDLCFYYEAERPLDLARLRAAATERDDAPRPELLTPLGG